MYLDQYFKVIEGLVAKIQNTQREQIEAAAAVVAESLAEKGGWFIMDTGHMLQWEAIRRAGGMVGITPFSYELNVNADLQHREIELPPGKAAALESQTVHLALEKSKLKKGDVLLINSNSGRSANVIAVALQAQERGIHTIGLASKLQMDHCESQHPSKRKLDQVTECFVDNCGGVGDAVLPVKDNERMCPLSGIGASFIFWAIHAHAVDLLEQKEIKPTIYRSVHTGSEAFMAQQEASYKERGI
tara:strand:- start:138 stop:872 length:735 start_codon:yes stop_codon:yes gene_type:complete